MLIFFVGDNILHCLCAGKRDKKGRTMRISFENRDLAEVKRATENHPQNPGVSLRGVSDAFDVSSAISDGKGAYESKRTSLEDFKNGIKDIDVKNTQDYMTVMAHTVSSEDYGEMVKEGVNPMSAEVKDSVTILDRIKLEVAKGGTVIEGFTDTLSEETIEAMTGSRKINGGLSIPEYDVTVDNDAIKESVQAFKELSDVTEMTDGMKKYFLLSGKDVTVGYLYLAKHSVEGFDSKNPGPSGYFSIEAPGYLAKRGDNSSENLTERVRDLLSGLSLPTDEETVKNGEWLVDNSVCVNGENLDRLAELNSISLPVSRENFVKVAASALAEGKRPAEGDLLRTESIYNEAVRLTRVMEETRLKMTAEANLMLLKSDYHIDTKDLEAYVEALKSVEATEGYKELKAVAVTAETVEAVKTLPAAVLAPISLKINEVSLSGILDEGAPIQARFEAAGLAYEQVGTQVRKDLGDSIKKAFRNVDEILKETGMDLTPENRRAVRILGYNSMAINKESVERVKEADIKVSGILRRITPEDTLKLIRNGKSPIEMSVKELSDYLDQKEDSVKEEIEKYSKFLYKLERNGDISEEERREYIEVYRFFHKLEKTDFAAVGSVLNAGNELTIGNLKTAMKTAKYRGMDIKVDESFGFLVSDIRNELSPERIAKTEFNDSTSLDALYKGLSEAEVTDEYDEAWNKEQYAEMKQALKTPEEAVTELVMNKVPVTAENLNAAFSLMKRRGSAFAEAFESDGLDGAAESEKLTEAFEDKESAAETYTELADSAMEAVGESALSKDRYVDVRALKLAFTELSLVKRYSESETYHVPVEISGELTDVTLKIVHNPDEEANVVISAYTEELGRIGARLFVENDEITGFITCNYKDALTKCKELADKISGGINVVLSKGSDDKDYKIPMRKNDDTVPTGMLYKAAKRFLEAVKTL